MMNKRSADTPTEAPRSTPLFVPRLLPPVASYGGRGSFGDADGIGELATGGGEV